MELPCKVLAWEEACMRLASVVAAVVVVACGSHKDQCCTRSSPRVVLRKVKIKLRYQEWGIN